MIRPVLQRLMEELRGRTLSVPIRSPFLIEIVGVPDLLVIDMSEIEEGHFCQCRLRGLSKKLLSL